MQYIKTLAYSATIGYKYYCSDSKYVAFKYKVTPQSAVEYAILYWDLFHKLASHPVRKDTTCFGRFFAMEMFCLKNQEYRKDRYLWFDNQKISEIKRQTKLSVLQNLWYLCAKYIPYYLYGTLLNGWINLSSILRK